MTSQAALLDGILSRNIKSLARTISIIENESPGYESILEKLTIRKTPVIGVTGPPGSGKSSLVNAMIGSLLSKNLKVGIIAVDPSSPFNFGALLGDRIRMTTYFNHPNVFIRSLSSRGSLGGLSDKIIEVLEVMKSFDFDYIFVETVGVGQSEVEVAGIADTTVIVLVPESGDHIQAMKAGLMEVGDLFVVNKSDHPDSSKFANNLKHLLTFMADDEWMPPIIKTVAIENIGVEELIENIQKHLDIRPTNLKKQALLADKIYRIIQKNRMKDIERNDIIKVLSTKAGDEPFNIFKFTHQHFLEGK